MQDLINQRTELIKQLNTAVNFYQNTGHQLAKSEMEYRIASRQEILRLHVSDGVAWTSCESLAKGDDKVAKLRFTRDIRKSDYECGYEKILQIKTEIRILEGQIEAERNGK
jgi:hypothetical protein